MPHLNIPLTTVWHTGTCSLIYKQLNPPLCNVGVPQRDYTALFSESCHLYTCWRDNLKSNIQGLCWMTQSSFPDCWKCGFSDNLFNFRNACTYLWCIAYQLRRDFFFSVEDVGISTIQAENNRVRCLHRSTKTVDCRSSLDFLNKSAVFITYILKSYFFFSNSLLLFPYNCMIIICFWWALYLNHFSTNVMKTLSEQGFEYIGRTCSGVGWLTSLKFQHKYYKFWFYISWSDLNKVYLMNFCDLMIW
jgi:hypothetical protein